MALDQLPPWLQISPRDYLLATQSGAQLGNTIAEQTQKAWEEQQRLRMESQTQENVAQQHAVENAMTRLAADRLEQYRQTEAANARARLGIEQQGVGIRGRELDVEGKRAETQQQRADDLARHQLAMEDAAIGKLSQRPTAGTTTLPGAPGFTFLQNPSGALTPLIRPPHAQSPLERARLQISGLNAMAPRGGEDPTGPDYQSRTNAVGAIMRSLSSQSPLDIPVAPADPKQRKANSTYKTPKGVFTWTGSGWQALTAQPTPQGAAIDPNEEDDGE